MTGVEDLVIGRQTQKSNRMYFVIRWLRSIVDTATAVEATNTLLVLTWVIWVPAQFFSFACFGGELLGIRGTGFCHRN